MKLRGFHVPALLVFLALTLLLAYPVVAGFWRAEVPGWEGDNLYYVRSMWWLKHALFDLHILPFHDPTAYYPVGHDLARSELTAPNTVLGLPFTFLAGPAVAYSAVVLFSFVATAFFTYLWVLRLTNSRAAGILAGAIVGFLPFRFAHLPGHLPQLTMQWLALSLYAFELFFERRTGRRAALLGVAVALSALGSWYYGYSLAIILSVYAIARTWKSDVWRDGAWWRGIGVSVAVAVAIMLPFLVEMMRLSSAGALDRSIVEMTGWGINFYDLFIPNVRNIFYGNAIANYFPEQRSLWVEKIHSLGYVALVMAAVGAWTWRRRAPRLVAALAIAWLISYSIALGPFLKSGDELVRMPVPMAVAEFAAQFAGAERDPGVLGDFIERGVPVPLPSAFMYKVVPFTKSMRVMARFSIWTAFMTAALAGFGLVTLLGWLHRHTGTRLAAPVLGLLVALVAFESATVVPTIHIGPRQVDLWLARQPDDVVVVELPVAQGTRPLQNWYATQHGRRMVFGWSGDSFPAPAEKDRVLRLTDFPSAASIEFLRSVRTTYVLMTPSQIPDWDRMEALVSAAPGLQFEQTFNDVRVYRVMP